MIVNGELNELLDGEIQNPSQLVKKAGGQSTNPSSNKSPLAAYTDPMDIRAMTSLNQDLSHS